MVGRLYTPFNGPGGQSFITDEDRFQANRTDSDAAREAAAAALAAQIRMHQADLADRQAGRMQQGSEFERGLSSQENESRLGRDFQGGLFDKQLGLSRDLDRSSTDRAFGLADRQNLVPMAEVNLARDQFNATNWRNELQKKFLTEQLGAMQGGAGGAGVAGGSGFTIDPEDRSAILTSVLSGQPAASHNQRELEKLQLEEARRVAGKSRVQDYINSGDVAAAEALAKQLGVAVNRPKYGNADASVNDLKSAVQGFAAKDNAMFGWDPNMGDVSRLDAQANQAISMLVRDYHMPIEEAQRIVNQAIQQSVAGQRGMATGWIDTLLQQRGIQ